jgi:hypothetical protein
MRLVSLGLAVTEGAVPTTRVGGGGEPQPNRRTVGTMTGAKRIGFLACVSEGGFPGPCAAKGGQAGTGRVIKGYFARGSLGNCLPYGGALTSDALTSIAALTVST